MTMTMDCAIRQRWLEALRSGEYSQTCSSLRNVHGYCCLGVLTDLAVKDGIGRWESGSHGAFIYRASDGDELEGVLPIDVQNWAGLPSYFGSTGMIGAHIPLATLNDRGTPFSEIADLIEEHIGEEATP